MTSPSLLHETGHSNLVHWDDPLGWDGEDGGWGVQDGEHMYTQGGLKSIYGNIWQYKSIYGKNQYNVVK